MINIPSNQIFSIVKKKAHWNDLKITPSQISMHFFSVLSIQFSQKCNILMKTATRLCLIYILLQNRVRFGWWYSLVTYRTYRCVQMCGCGPVWPALIYISTIISSLKKNLMNHMNKFLMTDFKSCSLKSIDIVNSITHPCSSWLGHDKLVQPNLYSK